MSADISLRQCGQFHIRVHSHLTYDLWQRGTRDERKRALTAAILKHQQSDLPVHVWPYAQLDEQQDWRHNFQYVGQFMSTDLFTVRPDDLIDLVACVMDWRHVRHVPVEDDEGCLVGLVSHRELLRLMARGAAMPKVAPVTVKQLMKPHPLTVSPQSPTLEAIELMRRHNIGCLPVVIGEKLVGIVTAYDFLRLSAELVEAQLKSEG